MTTLSATDANFLYAETNTCPMSIASVQYMQLPHGVSDTDFLNSLRKYLNARLHLVPYLTNVPQWPDGFLGHPNWIKATHVDIADHVYSVPVPAPGGRRQVEQTVARLHETPLPRHRPLWDLVVMTGLADNQVAYYNRVHHACLDGMSAQASTALLMDAEPTTGGDGEHVRKTPIPTPDRSPQSTADHLFNLFAAMATQAINQAVQAPTHLRVMSELAQRAIHPTRNFGALAQTAPATLLNKSIDRPRAFAMGEIPLKEAKNLAKSTNSSLNDVFLTICGGALRRYLLRHNACPETTLIAGCPVSLRQAGDKANNNQVTIMQVALGTDIDDTVERLASVRSSARTAKEVTATIAPILPKTLTAPGLGNSVHTMAQAAEYYPLAELMGNPSFNVLISNVPGPRQPLYSNGARMLSHYPVSIPAHGAGVNITCQSYVDRLYVGITACARTMPDADLLRDDIEYEWDNLHAALTADVVQLPASEEDTLQRAATAGQAEPQRMPQTMPADDQQVA